MVNKRENLFSINPIESNHSCLGSTYQISRSNVTENTNNTSRIWPLSTGHSYLVEFLSLDINLLYRDEKLFRLI
jgi:hypothetical protein